MHTNTGTRKVCYRFCPIYTCIYKKNYVYTCCTHLCEWIVTLCLPVWVNVVYKALSYLNSKTHDLIFFSGTEKKNSTNLHQKLPTVHHEECRPSPADWAHCTCLILNERFVESADVRKFCRSFWTNEQLIWHLHCQEAVMCKMLKPVSVKFLGNWVKNFAKLFCQSRKNQVQKLNGGWLSVAFLRGQT